MINTGENTGCFGKDIHQGDLEMNVSQLIGHMVTHIAYGLGEIIDANDKQITVRYKSESTKKYQFPQAFATYLEIDDESLQEDILEIVNKFKYQSDAEKKRQETLKAAQEANRINEAKALISHDQKLPKSKASRTPKPVDMKEVYMYGDGIIGPKTSFATHADVLNSLFGFHYKSYQKAGKNFGNGYSVWFPNIATRVGDKYLSSDDYWGWINILSDTGDTITQIDNTNYTYGTGEPDKSNCFIFAKFERNKRYTFIGLFGPAKRVNNKIIRTRIGRVVDIKNMNIIE